jgi:hypothetical protein
VYGCRSAPHALEPVEVMVNLPLSLDRLRAAAACVAGALVCVLVGAALGASLVPNRARTRSSPRDSDTGRSSGVPAPPAARGPDRSPAGPMASPLAPRAILRTRSSSPSDVAAILAAALGRGFDVAVHPGQGSPEVVIRNAADADAADADIDKKVEALIRDLDANLGPQVLLDAAIVELDTRDARKLGLTFPGGAHEAGLAVHPGFDVVAGSSRAGASVSARLRDLERRGRARTLANPRLIALCGALAQLRLGDKVIFSGGPSQPPEERDVDLILDITPVFGTDGPITLHIGLEQSSATTHPDGLPAIRRQKGFATIRVQDGAEAVIGGLPTLEAKADSRRSGRSPRRSRHGRELVVLLTPHILHRPDSTGLLPSEFQELLGAGRSRAARRIHPSRAEAVPPTGRLLQPR